ATITVIEGPELPLQQLSMGRGWRSAKRQGKDVTEELLAAARQESSGAVPAVGAGLGSGGGTGLGSQVDSTLTPVPPVSDAHRLAGELLELLGPDPVPLLRAWRLAFESHPDRTPSECLSLAEDLLRD
ncbi:MAG: hypothetical protein ACRDJ3_09780, partial [Solirubrobacteraceae bacterium]